MCSYNGYHGTEPSMWHVSAIPFQDLYEFLVLMKKARAGLEKMIIWNTFKIRKFCCQSKYLFNITASIKEMYTQNIAHKFNLFNSLKNHKSMTTNRVLCTVSWVRTEKCGTVYISVRLAPLHDDLPYAK
jgi:hypothetical protein